MNTATRYDWERIRAEYEAGATMGELSRRHGVSKPTISVRARKEGWTQEISELVNRMAEAKANGIANTVSPKKKAAAIDAAADAKAAVMLRHKKEWERHQEIMDAALDAGNFEQAKLAKITAETLKIRQEAERRAWGIQDKIETEVSGGVAVTHAVSAEVAEMLALVKGGRDDEA